MFIFYITNTGVNNVKYLQEEKNICDNRHSSNNYKEVHHIEK